MDFETSEEVKLTLNIFERNIVPVDLNLEFNIKEFQRSKNKGDYMPAILSFTTSDSVLVEKKIKLKARGNFRRKHCSFPPFWINIKKRDLSDTSLHNYKKLKIVTHCQNSGSYPEYVLKEYLAYQMYNIITDYSFRTSLLRVNYIDSGRKSKKTSTWAILIEPEEMLADRLDSYPMKIDHVGLKHTDSLQTDIMALYQFMIGNADYSISGRHNIKLINIKDFNRPAPLPIPYDFDYCGFINTSYAVPSENLNIESVRERYFLGACRSDEDYQKALQVFIDKKPEIISLIENFEFLSARSKSEAIAYIESFYSKLNQKNFFDHYIRSTCR